MKTKINKLTIIILILFISTFILTPKIYAGERTTTYTNYYLFLESYNIKNDINGTQNNDPGHEGEIQFNKTENETAFYRLNYGNKDGTLEVIPVKLSVSENEKEQDIAWSYQYFYQMYNEANKNYKNAKEYTAGGKYCYSHYTSKKNNTTYFTHGCWKPLSSSSWTGNQREITEIYEPTKYACASFSRDIEEKSLTMKKDGGDFLDAIIKRKKQFLNPNSINWDGNLNTNTSNCNNKIYPIRQGERLLIYNPIVYKYTYKVTEYFCDNIDINHNNNKCNSTTNIENDCNRKTITTENSVGEVEIKQKLTLNNILTPDSIYQGGGFKFGIVSQNTVSWKLLNLETGTRDEIVNEMKGKLKSEYAPLLTLTFKDKDNNILGTLDSGKIHRSCTVNGTFNEGDTLTTTCTFFLPNAIIENYTGKVDYDLSRGTNYGINNKYYTPLNFTGDYYITAELKYLNRLKKNSLDGMTPDDDWNITLNDRNTCKINVQKRLYNNPEENENRKYTFAFIYRPISIMDPFPNRNAGVNWFSWYKEDSNKERLEKSYRNLHYIATLDNIALQKVKSYNNNKDNAGGYSSWDFNSSGESEFINKNTFIERVGDR